MSIELVSTTAFTFDHDVIASAAKNAEVAAFDNATGLIFIAAPAGVDVLTQAGTLVGTIATAGLGAVNSVAAKDGVVAVALEAVPRTDPGKVLVLDVSFAGGAFSATQRYVAEVGALPDMITFSPDGTKLLTANEGEPNSYNQADSVDPEGSVSIIDVATGAVTTAGFTGFNGEMDALKAAGVRIFGPNATVAQDLEPEYIAISSDGATAYVTLQEANAIAVLDIASATFTRIMPLGFKDHSLPDNAFSVNDQDNVFLPQNYRVLGMYQPDGIVYAEFGGTGYLITANEGDARDYTGFTEEVRVGSGSYQLDPAVFPDAATLKQNVNLGRLTVTNATGDTDGDTDFDAIYAFGGRSFTVWSTDGELVFDSGNMLDEIIATRFPALYDENRDDNKGVEPESVAIATVGGNDYLFVGLERANTTLAFRMDGPTEFTFAGSLSTAGDRAPEAITVIPETATTPATLIVPNEASATTTAYALGETFTLTLLHHADFEGNTNAIADAPRLAALFDFFDDAPNTLKLSGGDNWIPSPWYNAQVPANAAALKPALQAVYEELLGLPSGSLTGLVLTPGAIDQAILNVIGIDASAIGNHEFDQGTAQIARIIEFAANAALSGDPALFELGDITNIGALYPTLTANLNFLANADLSDSFTAALLDSLAFTITDLSSGDAIAANLPANGKPKLAPFSTVEVGGETIGIVGATTQRLASISSPGTVTVEGGATGDNMPLLASQLQGEIDALTAAGVTKIILVSHLQDWRNEQELAGLLTNVDIILSGGSDAIFANPSDVLKPGDVAVNPYPLVLTGADGLPVLQVNTDGQYNYLGRLVVTFDADGVIIVGDLNMTDPTASDYSGAYAATDAVVAGLWGAENPYADGTLGGQVKTLTDAVNTIIGEKLANVAGFTDVFLNGLRGDVRNQETNFGNLTADANLFAAKQFLADTPGTVPDAPMVSLKNGGGIRDGIGLPLGVDGPEPPVGGRVTQLDIETALAFNNALVIVQSTAAGLLALLEHGVANAGTTNGRFPQVGGLSFSYDTSLPAGDRILSLAILGEDGTPALALAKDGALIVPAETKINITTLNFLAGGGDGYPFTTARVPGTTDVPLFAPASTPGFDVPGYEQNALAEYLATFFATPDEGFGAADTGRDADTRIQNLAFREDTVLDGIDFGEPAVIEFSLFQDATIPGRPELLWTGGLVSLALTDDDGNDTTGPLARLSEEDGNVAVFGADFANGVSVLANDPLISLTWDDGAAVLTHAAPWNAIKVLTVSDFTGEALTLAGWVDVDVNLGALDTDLALTVDGSKRGSIETGAGDDTIVIGADSNERVWSNLFVIDTGAGDDSVTIDGATEAYAAQSFAQSFFDAFATVEVKLGEGDDDYSGTGRDTAVYEGAIEDYVITATEDGFSVEDINLENGDEGTDTLSGIAFFRFGGTTYAADEVFA
ncbi:choice-of-anchor I family protein [Elioraea sp.]|uniref:choice-of-anchor I family protein n=1 Tax=Elioraea sp. TaxID=2185103 RepID=UPI0025BBE7E8|nr:choice-of-anchor I family protein [Elioraea sp.]